MRRSFGRTRVRREWHALVRGHEERNKDLQSTEMTIAKATDPKADPKAKMAPGGTEKALRVMLQALH